jgi:hypothetical protein
MNICFTGISMYHAFRIDETQDTSIYVKLDSALQRFVSAIYFCGCNNARIAIYLQ